MSEPVPTADLVPTDPVPTGPVPTGPVPTDAGTVRHPSPGMGWCGWLLVGWALWIGLACFAELSGTEDLTLALDLDRHTHLAGPALR